jgi:hypothetical protein
LDANLSGCDQVVENPHLKLLCLSADVFSVAMIIAD